MFSIFNNFNNIAKYINFNFSDIIQNDIFILIGIYILYYIYKLYQYTDKCLLCFEKIEFISTEILPCNHRIHYDCLDKCIDNKCPLCEKEIIGLINRFS